MKTSKFYELCQAFGKAQQEFESFQKDCHFVAVELVNIIKEYFDIPISQFSLYTLNENDEFIIVPPSILGALTLREDSYWQFGIGLTVCLEPEVLPEELILIQILVRKDVNGNFYVKYGATSKEFQVYKEHKESYYPFFDFIHQSILTTYNDQMHHFLEQKTVRKLGYIQNNEKE